MISFVDTSVFIAAFDANHIHHARSLSLYDKISRSHARCGAHTLAEVYSVLTRLPKPHRLRPEQALFFVERVAERVEPVALTSDEYLVTVRAAAGGGVSGGNIYDALLIACARKAKADKIYTWDIEHFHTAAPDLAERILEPGS